MVPFSTKIWVLLAYWIIFYYLERNKMPLNFWTEFLEFGRSEPAGIYCRYKKFFIKRNNSQRSHATLGLKLFTTWFHEFSCLKNQFLNGFIIHLNGSAWICEGFCQVWVKWSFRISQTNSEFGIEWEFKIWISWNHVD